MAGVVLTGAMYLSGVLSAQSLATPNFTTAQAAQGRAAYERSCASCHGTNLDDGEFAPPLKGVEFRLRFGGKPLDALHEDVLRMPPTAPNSLGDAVRAQILAYLAQENGVTATNRELSTDAAVAARRGHPGSRGRTERRPHDRRAAFRRRRRAAESAGSDHDRHRPDAHEPRRRRLADVAPLRRQHGLQPAHADRPAERRRSASRLELGAAERAQRSARRSCTTA